MQGPCISCPGVRASHLYVQNYRKHMHTKAQGMPCYMLYTQRAGAVHQYVSCPGERTSYLCELRSGREVLVCDPAGHTRR